MSRTWQALVGATLVAALVVLPATAASRSSAAKKPKTLALIGELTNLALGLGSCTGHEFDIPTGVAFRLVSATASFNSTVAPADEPRASLDLFVKTGEGTSSSIQIGVPLAARSGFGGPSGTDLGQVVAIEEPLADAEIGQVYRVRACLSRGSAPAGAMADVLLSTVRA